MNTTIDQRIEHDLPLGSSVREATRMLERQWGPESDSDWGTSADWKVSKDWKQSPLLDLTVSDRTGAVTYRFLPEELSDGQHMEKRLYRLRGDLLRVRSHFLTDRINWSQKHLDEVVTGPGPDSPRYRA